MFSVLLSGAGAGAGAADGGAGGCVLGSLGASTDTLLLCLEGGGAVPFGS